MTSWFGIYTFIFTHTYIYILWDNHVNIVSLENKKENLQSGVGKKIKNFNKILKLMSENTPGCPNIDENKIYLFFNITC